MILVDRLAAQDEEEWDDFLLRTPGALIYASSRYRALLRELLGCEERSLVARDGGAIVGALPLLESRGVLNSLPYYGCNGGVLAVGPAAQRALVEAYSDLVRADDVVAGTVIETPFAAQEPAALVATHEDRRISQATDLGDPLPERLEGSARRNIQKARAAGIVVERDPELLEWVAGCYRERITSMGGRAVAADFHALFPRFLRAGEEFDVYAARLDGEPIAGLVVARFGGTVEYLTPATVPERRSLQPMAAILAVALEDARREGATRWNWGGTWESQVSLYRFKRKWAARERPYVYRTQLNDESVLDLTAEEILERWHGFFVVPFSALSPKEEPWPAVS